MKIYITSDPHLFHHNAACPDNFIKARTHFKNVEEMNEAIIHAINSTVKKEDILINCDDFNFCKPEVLFGQLEQINASKIIFVNGNQFKQNFQVYQKP